jgi:hypothetical protein
MCRGDPGSVGGTDLKEAGRSGLLGFDIAAPSESLLLRCQETPGVHPISDKAWTGQEGTAWFRNSKTRGLP